MHAQIFLNAIWLIPAIVFILWLLYAIRTRQTRCFLFGLLVLILVTATTGYLTVWIEGWKSWYERDDHYKIASATLDALERGDTNRLREAYARFMEEPKAKDPDGFAAKQDELLQQLENRPGFGTQFRAN